MTPATMVLDAYLDVHAAARRTINCVLHLQTMAMRVPCLIQREHFAQFLGALVYAVTHHHAKGILLVLDEALPELHRHCTTELTCQGEVLEIRRAFGELDHALANLLVTAPDV